MLDNIYHYYAVDEDTAYGVLATDGRAVAPIDVTESIQQLLIENIGNAGYSISAIEPDVVQLGMGEIVPNWDDYTIV